MKNIQLTGIGNALVDLEYQVTEQELADFEVEKGGMTLTDASRQHEMITSLGERETHQSSGGSVANSTIAFAQFGGKGGFKSLLGRDSFGRFYASEFRDLGIELRAREQEGSTTGSCLVMITPDSERTLNTTLAVNSEYDETHVDEVLIQHSEWLLIEGYKFTDDTGAAAVDKALFYAKKHDTHVAVTCSDKFIVDVFGNRLRATLKSTDLVICNESEGMALADEGEWQGAYKSLKSQFKCLVFTRSEHGSHLAWDGRESEIPAYKVTAVDATGAGDMYAGAFLYGVLDVYNKLVLASVVRKFIHLRTA